MIAAPKSAYRVILENLINLFIFSAVRFAPTVGTTGKRLCLRDCRYYVVVRMFAPPHTRLLHIYDTYHVGNCTKNIADPFDYGRIPKAYLRTLTIHGDVETYWTPAKCHAFDRGGLSITRLWRLHKCVCLPAGTHQPIVRSTGNRIPCIRSRRTGFSSTRTVGGPRTPDPLSPRCTPRKPRTRSGRNSASPRRPSRKSTWSVCRPWWRPDTRSRS